MTESTPPPRILVILVLAALCGATMLEAFGGSLDAFSVASGVLLAWMGFGILRGETSDSDPSARDQPSGEESLSPPILFAASHGSITGVTRLAVVHAKTDLPLTALVAIAVTIIVAFCVMLLLSFLDGKQQGGFVHDTVTLFMGLIVVAMGVQFALTGIKSFMS